MKVNIEEWDWERDLEIVFYNLYFFFYFYVGIDVVDIFVKECLYMGVGIDYLLYWKYDCDKY